VPHGPDSDDEWITAAWMKRAQRLLAVEEPKSDQKFARTAKELHVDTLSFVRSANAIQCNQADKKYQRLHFAQRQR